MDDDATLRDRAEAPARPGRVTLRHRGRRPGRRRSVLRGGDTAEHDLTEQVSP